MADTEIQRISKLPTRSADYPELLDFEALAQVMTQELRRPGSSWEIWPVQARALTEILYAGGLVAPIPVGGGKTLVSLLAGTALGAKRTLIIVPGPLVKKTRKESIEYAQHFYLPKIWQVMSYSQLSRQTGWQMLEDFKPDLIVCDEAHKLANRKAARTRKVVRYFKEHPETKFVAMSGTMQRKGVSDYSHLSFLALRSNSPVPIEQYECTKWDAVIGTESYPTKADFAYVAPLKELCPPELQVGETLQQQIRLGYEWRVNETVGVVSAAGPSYPGSVIGKKVEWDADLGILGAMEDLENYWERPDGKELSYALEQKATERQLSLGFYYAWDWGPEGPDEEFLEARKDWHGAVRRKLKYTSTEKENYDRTYDRLRAAGEYTPLLDAWDLLVADLFDGNVDKAWHYYANNDPENNVFKNWRRVVREYNKSNRVYLDSPLQVYNWYRFHNPEDKIFQKWNKVKDRPKPPVLAVWVSDTVVEQAAEWALKQKKPTILWCHYTAVLHKLAEHMPTYGAGTEIPTDNPMTCAAKIRTHGTGKQLQAWSHMGVLEPPSAGLDWQQLIGRMARPGQESDEVYVTVNTAGIWGKALKSAQVDAQFLDPQRREHWLHLMDWVDE